MCKMIWRESYNFGKWDIGSLKLAMIFFTFVILKIWGGLARWVDGTNIWLFVLLLVLFSIKPLNACLKNEKKAIVKKITKKVKRKKK